MAVDVELGETDVVGEGTSAPPNPMFSVCNSAPALKLSRDVPLAAIMSKQKASAPKGSMKLVKLEGGLGKKPPLPSLSSRRVAPEPSTPPAPQSLPSPQAPGFIAALITPLTHGSDQRPPSVVADERLDPLQPDVGEVADAVDADVENGSTADARAEPSELSKLPEQPPMWKVMKLDGLEGFDQEFKVKLAEKTPAQELARLRGCTRKLVKLEGEEVAKPSETDMVSLLGSPLQSLDLLHILPQKGENMREYGCAAAVILYLRFQTETAALFLLLFMLSLVQISDSTTRGDLRNSEPHPTPNLAS
jgi:hypothetical protein